MRRLEFSAQTKRGAFKRSCGICECHLIPWLRRPKGCGVKLTDGTIFYEHINPDSIRQDNSIDNAACLTKTCWAEKTNTYDKPVIARANRQRDRARGIRSISFTPLPGGRDDQRKKKMSGLVVDRATGLPFGGRR